MALFAFVKICCSDGGAPAVAQNPVLTDPAFSLENSVGALAKVAAQVNVTLTYHFDRGAIDGSAYGGAILPRAGAATGYAFKKPDNTDFAGGQVNGNTAIVPYTVAKGYNDLIGRVVYDAGTQPTNSLGADYMQPYPAGTHEEKSRIEGVYPIYTGLAGIPTVDKFGNPTTYDNLMERSLVSLITGNYIEYTLPAVLDGAKQAFAIANPWLADRPLAKVEYYNDLFQRWEDADQRPDFTTSAVSFSVSNINVAYTQYKNISPDRGALRLRFIF